MDKLLGELNKDQFAAATTAEQSVIVVAGAGSGKTKTLISRIVHLLESGVDPSAILAITFTRKATNVIRSRVADYDRDMAKQVNVSTFHGWAAQIIQGSRTAQHTVIDRDDQLYLMGLARGKRSKDFPRKETLTNIYSYCRNTAMRLHDYLVRFEGNLLEHEQEFIGIYNKYQGLKKERKYHDYDDILEVVAVAMEKSVLPTLIGDRYSHILVDETQDTNPLQWRILEPLIGKVNLFCVGDDAQSIYAFRGSNYKMVNEFINTVPGAKRYSLNQNYRSPNQVLGLANWLLEQSDIPYDKVLFSELDGGKPEFHIFDDAVSEASWIADFIAEQHEGGVPLRDHLVLFRSGFASRQVEAQLIKRKIPLIFQGGTQFMAAAHVKDLISLLRVVSNWRDTIAWMRYLTMFKGVGDSGAAEFCDACMEMKDHSNMVEGIRSGVFHEKLNEVLKIYAECLAFKEDLSALTDTAIRLLAPTMAEKWGKSWGARQRDLPILKQLQEPNMDVDAFLASYVFNELGEAYKSDDTNEEDVVVLSTIHSAKGQEAPYVILPKAEPGEFPHSRTSANEDREEERRVLYVALTRSQKKLILTKTMGRSVDHRNNNVASAYFFEDLPNELYETVLHTQPGMAGFDIQVEDLGDVGIQF